MTTTEWAALVPAIVALLAAVTALVRLELHQRSVGVSGKHAANVPNSQHQSCTRKA
jgi:hypothetical protein